MCDGKSKDKDPTAGANLPCLRNSIEWASGRGVRKWGQGRRGRRGEVQPQKEVSIMTLL